MAKIEEKEPPNAEYYWSDGDLGSTVEDNKPKRRISVEAPANLGSDKFRDPNRARSDCSSPVDMANHGTRRKPATKQRPWSRDSSCEEAWLKKKRWLDDDDDDDDDEEEEDSPDLAHAPNRRKSRDVERSVSFCGTAGNSCWPVDGVKSRHRARSLTDEDLDELRGFIDLGFRFSYEEEDHRLCNTLPALDLYYAVNRQYIDCRKSKTPSLCCSLNRSVAASGSPMSPHCDTWKIASPA